MLRLKKLHLASWKITHCTLVRQIKTHYSLLSEIRLNDDGLIAGRHPLA
jgi:hypothetical protein